jgi:1,4-alpha-glucan branching enzyme
MYIQLPKPITEAVLDSFVTQFDLADLDLKSFLKTNNPDSLSHLGWKVEINNEIGLVISKAMEPIGGLSKLDQKFFFNGRRDPLFPSVNNGIIYGVNRFRNKPSFLVADSIVRFFLRNNQQADRVMLAGSFNNWVPNQLAMQKTDSGWIYNVKLGPGKYWYKFIVDGNWIVDRDNLLSENDGRGNVNSVFFRPNRVFTLRGFTEARKVFLAGSFNGWKPDGLPMQKTATGWELPLYLAEGTHTYKFVADGTWVADPGNAETVPDGTGGVNSVTRRGKPYVFHLNGHKDAKEVILVGSFNQWRDFEWRMKKTATGWELPYTLGPGNYEYKFKVDGKMIADPANPLTSPSSGSSYLVLHPNYTFRLQGFSNAREVFLAGNFNQWDPRSYPMKREGDVWVFPVHLSVGKHLYKFIVDGKWIIDPGNKLWEQNEHGTGNSILWIEK